jgi:SAM-dependent methyltransferase
MPHLSKLRNALRRLRRPVFFGTLRRTTPLSSCWGCERGTPVGRYYIEKFLADHRSDITGCVLEVQDPGYTQRFGTGVRKVEILDIDRSNPRATIYADLASCPAIADSTFDCLVITQVFQAIWDIRSAVAECYRILRPGGVLLATIGCVCMIDGDALDYWHLTPSAFNQVAGEVFGTKNVEVHGYGNALAAISSVMGISSEELTPDEINDCDARFAVITAVRAVKRLA